MDTGQVATGLVNFRPIFGADRQVTAVYAGDLQGNLWKLDFAAHGKDEWTLEKLSAFNDGNEANPLPLFIAMDAAGQRQPITMAPSVAAGPAYNGARTTYVAFCTGKYLEPLGGLVFWGEGSGDVQRFTLFVGIG